MQRLIMERQNAVVADPEELARDALARAQEDEQRQRGYAETIQRWWNRNKNLIPQNMPVAEESLAEESLAEGLRRGRSRRGRSRRGRSRRGRSRRGRSRRARTRRGRSRRGRTHKRRA